MEDPLLWLGAVLCALAAGVALLPLPRRFRLLGASLALALAPAILAADNWESDRVLEIRDQPLLIAAAASLAIAAVGIGALLLRRRPGLLAPLLAAALPFRVPVDLGGGGEPANLLLPLYGLIAAGLLAAWLTPATADARGNEGPAGRLRWSGPALAAFIAVYALCAGYADDLSPAIGDVAFFFAPFAALYLLLGEVRWDPEALRAIVWVLAAEGALFAVVAAYQLLSGELLWNDKVIAGNEAHAYFRVNSLFWDPNILGRYLAVSMVALAAVAAFGRERARLVGASVLYVVLLATLVVTYSQSSAIALIAGVLVLVAARLGLLAGAAAGLLALLALAASVLLIGGGAGSDESSGRSGLIGGGLEIAADAPLAGTGSGTFAAEFKERFGGGRGIAVESHTEPVTVAAEQGAIGLAAYAGLLAATIGGLLGAAGLRLRGPASGSPLAAALLAIYAAMIVHSLGYAAFLTDPITWVTLALAATALGPRTRRAPEPASPAGARIA